MKKGFFAFFLLFLALKAAFSQCTPATVRGTATVNTPNYALNTAFNSGNAAPATISNLSSGMFSFSGSVAGTARWGNGIRIQNDPTVGDYIYVQPQSTNNTTTANIATYTLQFNEAVTNFSLRCAGLNNQDQLRITAFNGATAITLSNANFTDNVADPGNSGTIVISGGNVLTGNNTAGGTSVNTNRITLTIPGPVTRIVMTSGKADANNTSTVTLGFTSLSYTRCVKVPPDINASFVNMPVTGNVGTNDIKPTGTTYGTPTAQPGNPGPALPSINADGTYTFTAAVAGVYKFSVPMCPGSVVSPDCPLIDLVIRISDASASNNKPFANTDMATTLVNTAVTLPTLANDKAGSNNAVTLNPASVVILTQPQHGTASVNSTTGEITYTPGAGYTGYDRLTYEVSDRSLPTAQTATADQIITILPAASENSTVASDDYNSTPLNTTVSGNVRANDIDPENNTQTITTQTTTITGKGTLTLASNGDYTFVPVSGFNGPVNFPYQVCDNGAPSVCAAATLYLLVFPSASLPLDLLSFQAVSDNGDVKLIWTTANQDNVNRFELERAPLSSGSYSVIGTVPANTERSGTYSFTDLQANRFMDRGYYRLKMVDNDGRFRYSRTILVNTGGSVTTTLQPNVVPAGQPVMLYVSGTQNQRSYRADLISANGQVLQTVKGVSGSYQRFDTYSLKKGVYIIRIIRPAGVVTEKLVVQ
jgi:hypothetical protein